MSTLFDLLFPQELLCIAQNIIKMKRKYDNSIPKLLLDNGYLKCTKQLYINPIKNIILYYTKTDVKNNNRQNVFNELIHLNNMYSIGCNQQYQLIYGYLNTKINENNADSIVLHNVTINIMSGELLLRHVLDNYNNIIFNISEEINRSFSPIQNNTNNSN